MQPQPIEVVHFFKSLSDGLPQLCTLEVFDDGSAIARSDDESIFTIYEFCPNLRITVTSDLEARGFTRIQN